MPVTENENDAEHGHVPGELLTLFEDLEADAQAQGFAHLNELRDVLILEGTLPDE